MGQYVQGHDGPEPKNTYHPRTIDALYLRPVDMGHYLYCLATGQIINRAYVTPVPFTPSVIQAVNKIAAKEHQKGLGFISLHGDVFFVSSWTAGVDYEEEDYKSDDEEDFEEEDSDNEDADWDNMDSTESTTDDEDQSQSSEDSEEAREILYEEVLVQQESKPTTVETEEEQEVEKQ